MDLKIYGQEPELRDTQWLARLLGGPRHLRMRRAQGILRQLGGLPRLRHARTAALKSLPLSHGERQRLEAALELAQRLNFLEAPAQICSPEHAYRALSEPLVGHAQERFAVIVLDTKNRPRHCSVVAAGGLDSCPVDPRIVFLPALRHGGCSIIVGHNHPSGDPHPSRQDIALTERLVQAGEIIGLPVLDHIIVGNAAEHPPGYLSFVQDGLLPMSRATNSQRSLQPAG